MSANTGSPARAEETTSAVEGMALATAQVGGDTFEVQYDPNAPNAHGLARLMLATALQNHQPAT